MENLVTFPGLGLEFLLNRVFFEFFGRPIYWYGVIIAMGFLAGTMVASHLARKINLKEDHVYDYLFFAVPAALVGLRTYYVLFYLDSFKNSDGSLDWAAIVRISDGGMAIYGGIIAGIIVLHFYTRKKEITFWQMGDIAVPGIILGQAIGRWGNFMNVEAYGDLTAVPWRMCSSSIAYEMQKKGYATLEQAESIITGELGVHPTFFYESAWNFLGFLVLMGIFYKKRTFEGKITLWYFVWYGLGRSVIEGMRTDSLYFFGLEFMGIPLRTSQVLSLVLCFGAFCCLLRANKGKISSFRPVELAHSGVESAISGEQLPENGEEENLLHQLRARKTSGDEGSQGATSDSSEEPQE